MTADSTPGVHFGPSPRAHPVRARPVPRRPGPPWNIPMFHPAKRAPALLPCPPSRPAVEHLHVPSRTWTAPFRVSGQFGTRGRSKPRANALVSGVQVEFVTSGCSTRASGMFQARVNDPIRHSQGPTGTTSHRMPTRETATHRALRRTRTILRRVGEALRVARVGSGMSTRRLGSLVGISHTQVLRIESGHSLRTST